MKKPFSMSIPALLAAVAFAAAAPAATAQPQTAPAAATAHASSAAALHPRFVEAFNARDLEALMALFHPDAGFVPAPGQLVSGHAGIREVLQSFLSVNGTLQLDTVHAVEVGDLALLRGHYRLRGTDKAGKPVEFTGRTVEVARKQPNGAWLYVIDSPQGAD
jgi:uncharacterized protein (TIGR02246 family)